MLKELAELAGYDVVEIVKDEIEEEKSVKSHELRDDPAIPNKQENADSVRNI